MPPDARHIEKLRREIRRHNRLYYADARPVISDREYDELLEELEELEEKRPDLVTSDSPTQRVGGGTGEGQFASYLHQAQAERIVAASTPSSNTIKPS